jgi:hypothetical protein
VGCPLWSASRRLSRQRLPAARSLAAAQQRGQCSPIVASPAAPFLGAVLPSWSKSLHRASFLGIVCYACMRQLRPEDSANIRQLSAHFTSSAPSTPQNARCPPSHMHTSPRAPAIPHSAPVPRTKASGTVPSHQEHFRAHQTQTWVAQSVRDSAEQLPSLTTTPKAGSCPCPCGYTGTKSSEPVLGWHFELDTSTRCLGFTSDNILYNSPSLNAHL